MGEVVRPVNGDSGIGPKEMQVKNRVKLSEEELKAYEDALQAAKEKAAQRKALLARTRRRLEADDEDDDDDDSDSDDELGNDEFGEFPTGEAGGLSRKRGFTAAFEDEVAKGATNDGTQVSFDIFLKGNASRVTSFFGSKAEQTDANAAAGESGAGVRYRMFPFQEKRRRIDAYGEAIDVGRWLTKKHELEEKENDQSGQGETADKLQRAKTQAQKEKEAAPSKFVVGTVTLQIQCGLAYVDMDGLNDARALKTLLPQLHPRRLIMVNADSTTREDMRLSLHSVKAMTKDIWAPCLGFSVSIGESTVALTVNLGDTLVSGLRLSQFEDFEVAYLRSAFKVSDQSSLPTLEGVQDQATEAKAEEEEMETPDPEGDAEDGEVRPKPQQPVSISAKAILPTIFIGDLKLSSLKAHLAVSRIAADFAGDGLLVCGLKAGGQDNRSAITVQKEGEGKIIVEGNVGQSFYDVRNKIYDLHAHINA